MACAPWAQEHTAPPALSSALPTPTTLHPGTPSRWLSSQAWGPLGTALPVTSCQGGQGEGEQGSRWLPAAALTVGTAQPPRSRRSGWERGGLHSPSAEPLLCTPGYRDPLHLFRLPALPQKGFISALAEGEAEASQARHTTGQKPDPLCTAHTVHYQPWRQGRQCWAGQGLRACWGLCWDTEATHL